MQAHRAGDAGKPGKKERYRMALVNWKDVWVRSLKTFVQAAFSCLIASLSGVNFTTGTKNETFWVGLGLAACAAGLSAAWNGILQPIFTTATQESDGDRNG